MPIRYEGNVAIIDGFADIDEAEGLLAFLRTADEPVVDATNLTRVHTSVAQLLVVSNAEIRGDVRDPALVACLKMGRGRSS
jgi:hypothetical protein